MRALALGGFLLGLCTRSAAAQHATLGPAVAVAEYREVASSLRYSGVGPGASGRSAATYGRAPTPGTTRPSPRSMPRQR